MVAYEKNLFHDSFLVYLPFVIHITLLQEEAALIPVRLLILFENHHLYYQLALLLCPYYRKIKFKVLIVIVLVCRFMECLAQEKLIIHPLMLQVVQKNHEMYFSFTNKVYYQQKEYYWSLLYLPWYRIRYFPYRHHYRVLAFLLKIGFFHSVLLVVTYFCMFQQGKRQGWLDYWYSIVEICYFFPWVEQVY